MKNKIFQDRLYFTNGGVMMCTPQVGRRKDENRLVHLFQTFAECIRHP